MAQYWREGTVLGENDIGPTNDLWLSFFKVLLVHEISGINSQYNTICF